MKTNSRRIINTLSLFLFFKIYTNSVMFVSSFLKIGLNCELSCLPPHTFWEEALNQRIPHISSTHYIEKKKFQCTGYDVISFREGEREESKGRSRGTGKQVRWPCKVYMHCAKRVAHSLCPGPDSVAIAPHLSIWKNDLRLTSYSYENTLKNHSKFR